MMRLLSATFATFALAVPAFAQDRMTPETCTKSWAAVETLTGLPASDAAIIADGEGRYFVRVGRV